LVVIAAQEDREATGRIRLKQVADASAESLEAAVQETVEPGAKVKTDGWCGYNGLRSRGYKHKVIRKTAVVGENLLPLCHREASLIKRWLAGTHQGAVSHEHLGYYLDEYTFRFNRRTSSYRGKLFYRLLQNAVVLEPVRYDDITLKARGPKPKHKM
jgi:transposase-like protein